MSDTKNQKNSLQIDLHLHSTLSDGLNTVAEVIELARQEGMRVIALSDHNLFAITEKIVIGCGENILEVIPACEFSTTYYSPFRENVSEEIHVVGLFPYGVDPASFKELFDGIAQGKLNYIAAIIKKLNELGIEISMDEVMSVKETDGFIGRHRIADVLIAKGYGSTYDEIFDSYIGNFSPYYIKATAFIPYAPLDTVVQEIIRNNGIPILCHPYGYSFREPEIELLVKQFAKASKGAGAMEVYYEKYLDDPHKISFLEELQKKYSLMASVASDRHRPDQPFATGGNIEYYKKMLDSLKRRK